MPTEGKPPSNATGKPEPAPQATTPELDPDRGWSQPPLPTAPTTPDLAKAPGFPPPPPPPPPPLPPARVAELHSSTGHASLPVPTVPTKEVTSSAGLKEPPAAPPLGPQVTAPAHPALARTEPQPVLPVPAPNPARTEPQPALLVPAPNPALTATEPQRPAVALPGTAPAAPTVASPPAFPVPPALPTPPPMPPPIPMSAVAPSVAKDVLISPVGEPVVGAPPTPGERAPSRFAGFFARLFASRPSGAWLLIGLLVVFLAFGAGLLTGRSLVSEKPANATDAEPEKKSTAKRSEPSEPKRAADPASPTPVAASRPAEGGGGSAKTAFNAKAAKAAVDRAAARAKRCRSSRDPAGNVATTVTFAPSGKVSDVTITTPRYAGTKTGACIESRLREARVPEFTGSPGSVQKSVTIR